MKKMLVVVMVLGAMMMNVSMVSSCLAAENHSVSLKTVGTSRKGGTVLGNKNINPYELFQIHDAATCLEDILGGKK